MNKAASDVRVRGVFLHGSDKLLPLDDLELHAVAQHLKHRYGGDWRLKSSEPCMRILDDSHYEDGAMLLFEKRGDV